MVRNVCKGRDVSSKVKWQRRRRRTTRRTSVEMKVKKLQMLIPGGKGLKLDPLFLLTADYIQHLRLQLDILQALSYIFYSWFSFFLFLFLKYCLDDHGSMVHDVFIISIYIWTLMEIFYVSCATLNYVPFFLLLLSWSVREFFFLSFFFFFLIIWNKAKRIGLFIVFFGKKFK